MDIPYQEINSKTIDRWVEEGWEWGKPVSHEEYEKAKAGTWDVKLTPVKFVPHSWLGELKGKRVLGLASGGGQQMPIFAALGAQCTVLDYSQRQLDSEKMVAEREGYDITIVRADMTCACTSTRTAAWISPTARPFPARSIRSSMKRTPCRTATILRSARQDSNGS